MSQEKDNILDEYTKIKNDLKRIVNDIEEELHNNLEETLDNALDAILFVTMPNKEPVGFDIAVGLGSPNVFIVYQRGTCQIRAYWGSEEVIRTIDANICEEIMEHLS